MLRRATTPIFFFLQSVSVSVWWVLTGLFLLQYLLLRDENNLHKSSVMVTSGANQAFVNLILTLCDPGDSVVMFAPYYFNAYMSFQMTGITNILVGPGSSDTLHPDAGNPSGTYIPEKLLKRISDLCKNAGSWLVVDNTYEVS